MTRHLVHHVDLYENEGVKAVLFRVDPAGSEDGWRELLCVRTWWKEKGRPRRERGPRVIIEDLKLEVPVLSIEISDEGRRIAIRAISRSFELDLTSDELDTSEERLTWMRIVLAEMAEGSRCEVVDRDGTPDAPPMDSEADDLEGVTLAPEERELFVIMKAVMEADDPQAEVPASLPKLEDLVARKPRFIAARSALGSTLSELGRYEEAIPHLEVAARAATADEPDSDLFAVLVEALYVLERHEESLAWHQRRLELYPHEKPALKDYFVTLMALDRDEEILKECDRLEVPELEDFFFVARGEALQRLGRLDDALGSFRKYEKEHPRDPEIHVRLAQLYLVRGDVTKARKACERSESLLPKKDTAESLALLAILGALWKGTGDEVGLRRITKRLRRMDPEMAEVLLR